MVDVTAVCPPLVGKMRKVMNPLSKQVFLACADALDQSSVAPKGAVFFVGSAPSGGNPVSVSSDSKGTFLWMCQDPNNDDYVRCTALEIVSGVGEDGGTDVSYACTTWQCPKEVRSRYQGVKEPKYEKLTDWDQVVGTIARSVTGKSLADSSSDGPYRKQVQDQYASLEECLRVAMVCVLGASFDIVRTPTVATSSRDYAEVLWNVAEYITNHTGYRYPVSAVDGKSAVMRMELVDAACGVAHPDHTWVEVEWSGDGVVTTTGVGFAWWVRGPGYGFAMTVGARWHAGRVASAMDTHPKDEQQRLLSAWAVHNSVNIVEVLHNGRDDVFITRLASHRPIDTTQLLASVRLQGICAYAWLLGELVKDPRMDYIIAAIAKSLARRVENFLAMRGMRLSRDLAADEVRQSVLGMVMAAVGSRRIFVDSLAKVFSEKKETFATPEEEETVPGVTPPLFAFNPEDKDRWLA